MNDDVLCSYIWPFQLFSFLCAFGMVILIAHRFKRVNTGYSRREHLNFPLSIVPLVSLVLTAPTIIFDQIVPSTQITELISGTHKNNNEFCFFSSSPIGTAVNYVCLQLPSLITIVYNIHCYRLGVQSLESAPHQVYVRKAGD